MGRTDAVAVGDRRKSLYVRAEETREHLGLGLAHLGELLGHMGDRAVVLAHLGAGGRGADRRGVAVLAECIRENVRALIGRHLRQQRTVAILEVRQPVAGERHHGLVSPGVSEVAQGAGGELVVRVLEVVAARVGDHVDLGGTSSTALTHDTLLTRPEEPIGEQLVEVTTLSLIHI